MQIKRLNDLQEARIRQNDILLRQQKEAVDAQNRAIDSQRSQQLIQQGIQLLSPNNGRITCYNAPGSPITSCN